MVKPTLLELDNLSRLGGALKSDTDIDSTAWSGAVIDGSDEIDCSTDTPQDCIYDLGYKQ